MQVGPVGHMIEVFIGRLGSDGKRRRDERRDDECSGPPTKPMTALIRLQLRELRQLVISTPPQDIAIEVVHGGPPTGVRSGSPTTELVEAADSKESSG